MYFTIIIKIYISIIFIFFLLPILVQDYIDFIETNFFFNNIIYI